MEILVKVGHKCIDPSRKASVAPPGRRQPCWRCPERQHSTIGAAACTLDADTSFGARRTENFGSSLNERSRILRSQHTVSHLLSQDTNRATSADKKAELEVFKKEVLSVRDQVSERLQRRSHAHSRTACGWDAHGCS